MLEELASHSRNLHEDSWDWGYQPNVKEVDVDGRRVMFHPEYAFGTAAVRGEKKLTSSTIAYWEIVTCQNYFGTSIMFGLGDEAASTQSIYQFTNLLGKDNHSYGVNHQGLAYHNGIGFKLCDPIGNRTKNAIGIFFDGPNQTISYFVDGEYVGTPFANIDLSKPLYPMVSSTAQQSQFVVQNQLSWSRPSSLFDLSLKSVYRTFPTTWSRLPLPQTILHDLEQIDALHRRYQRTASRRRHLKQWKFNRDV